MRNPAHPFFLVILGIAVGAGLSPSPAYAARSVVCESIDNRLTHCDVGWKSALMDRQLSRTACVRGETWGIDRGMLWVDGGCRASFVRAYESERYMDDPLGELFGGSERARRRDSGPWRRAGPAPRERFEQTIECNSIDKQYTFCPVGGDNRSGRLVNRRSEADCREGKGWGWNADGVWVSRGCRGVFAVEGGRR